MKAVYASRIGNVESFVSRLGTDDVLKIADGNELVDEDYILITYTDGFGIIPKTVERFLNHNSAHLKAAAVSGDMKGHHYKGGYDP